MAIDEGLARQAGELLGTCTLKETIDSALREVVAADARRRFVDRLRDMRGMDLDQPDVMAGAWR
ncbi:MAG: type II toxin-antitoxin system VapB family antitoxin [Candidatus Dormibacteraeota bacterium]|nr:type II toxin-antitoxin system VapB family antitoxin [Candidatus Dormibacteraeota bacterium]